ncbi:hypothetical protein [Georgenia sp. H159]|uniref:hypothetical protein n=1 Tax=Georgenia sp. H159 TaxID=3076115 RepID=UPI002D79C787|nr:hypothetical protein [Georgenia sp. H159]
MGDILKAVTSGFSRFALSWLLPSSAAIALFAIFLYPYWQKFAGMRPFREVIRTGFLETTVLIAFLALLLSLVFALASLPIYRLFEGYLLPSTIATALKRRRLAEVRKLRRRAEMLNRRKVGRNEWEVIQERLANYPAADDSLLPTRLGNAYKAIERYGHERFGLDSQALWYELHAVASGNLRKDSDDARSSVDFFVALATYLLVLALLSIATALTSQAPHLLVVAAIFIYLAWLAYGAAVRNMTDLRYAIQAIVNVNRVGLMSSLGYRMPQSLAAERRIWRAWSLSATGNGDSLERLDKFRAGPPASDS